MDEESSYGYSGRVEWYEVILMCSVWIRAAGAAVTGAGSLAG